uniref:Uncharacterized protein n=1 Tax=Vespula pensylvanica TaxID=30213 RepID=A0A834NQJ8_VESPE|nr:hypothetical protein H0235_012321 [Vespula pensylvanica]
MAGQAAITPPNNRKKEAGSNFDAPSSTIAISTLPLEEPGSEEVKNSYKCLPRSDLLPRGRDPTVEESTNKSSVAGPCNLPAIVTVLLLSSNGRQVISSRCNESLRNDRSGSGTCILCILLLPFPREPIVSPGSANGTTETPV